MMIQRTIGSGKETYDRLRIDREPYLRRGREASRLTIPHLLPENEYEQNGMVSEDLAEAYQSIGARGVNNISSKMLLSLFPVGTKFFRLQVDRSSLLNRDQFKQIRTEVEESLSEIEDIGLDLLETSGMRISLHQALRLTVCTGNALLNMPQDRTPRVFRLDSYVIERDPRGHILTIITRQRISPKALEAKIKKSVSGLQPEESAGSGGPYFTVYTIVHRIDEDSFVEWQEINGQLVGRILTHPADRLPYIPMRMYTTDGEHYGRGYVEEYIGDLKALEGLRESIVAAALAASRVQPLVNPDGITSMNALQRARNGQYVSGRADDVTFLHLDKFADLRTVRDEIESLKRDIGLVFLLNSTVQRNAERVTAEEVRLVAQELDDMLGGIFSQFSNDVQLPLVRNILGRLEGKGSIPKLPKMIKPVVVTGLDAIGRGHDLQKMRQLFGVMQESFGPPAMEVVDMRNAWRQAATAVGVDTESLLKTQEQIEQERRAVAMREVALRLGPEAMKQFPQEMQAAAEQFAGTAAGT